MFKFKKKIAESDVALDLDDLATGDIEVPEVKGVVKEIAKARGGKKSWNVFKIMNDKITGMGYSYSIVSFLKSFLSTCLLIMVLGYYHKLRLSLVFILGVIFLFMIPFSIYAQYKYLYEQKRFQELCVYLKQMKINFKASKKILIALEETLISFNPDDRIYPYIVKAIRSIKKGMDYRRALDIIEENYKNSYITKLHAYMILGEKEGGSAVYQALDNIDFETWRTDTYVFQTQKYKYQGQNSIYTMIGMAISLTVIFIFNKILSTPGNFFGDIFGSASFQTYTFIYILVNMISYVSIKSLITGKWIREDE